MKRLNYWSELVKLCLLGPSRLPKKIWCLWANPLHGGPILGHVGPPGPIEGVRPQSPNWAKFGCRFYPLINHYIKLQPPRGIAFVNKISWNFVCLNIFPYILQFWCPKFEKKNFGRKHPRVEVHTYDVEQSNTTQKHMSNRCCRYFTA